MSSYLPGVYWNSKRKKWCARVQIDNKKHFIGYYDEEKGAAQAVLNFRFKKFYSETNKLKTKTT